MTLNNCGFLFCTFRCSTTICQSILCLRYLTGSKYCFTGSWSRCIFIVSYAISVSSVSIVISAIKRCFIVYKQSSIFTTMKFEATFLEFSSTFFDDKYYFSHLHVTLTTFSFDLVYLYRFIRFLFIIDVFAACKQNSCYLCLGREFYVGWIND